MDTTDVAIEFDNSGVCDHCRTFDTHTARKWRRGVAAAQGLDEIVKAIRAAGAGQDFDCIIGMSGGIDSSYLTYIAKEVLGLRPLVFHVDAGWNSAVAVNNIEKMVDGLGLELHTEVIDWDEMRDLQVAYFRSGVPHIDTPQDHAFFATMYKFAEKHNVRYILTGGNLSTECVRNPVNWMYYQSDSVQLRDIHRRFGRRRLETFPITSVWRHKLYLPYVKGIKVVRPLDLVPYVKSEAIRELAEKFGWQPYPRKHFESRFTRFYESYWLPVRFGYDVRRVQFSSLILTGQMSRVEALKELEKPPFDSEEMSRELRFICDKLMLSREELEGFMNMPTRTFRDYKSQVWGYRVGASILKAVGLEIGGKR